MKFEYMSWETWEEAALYCKKTFGVYINWEERFFICPECEEPILEEDWKEENLVRCPICETYWTDIE